MKRENIYRIYTEDKNKKAIVKLVKQQFESFTLQPTVGYYRGSAEKSIVVEIVGATPTQIKRVAERIQKMNGQKSVLILKVTALIEAHRA